MSLAFSVEIETNVIGALSAGRGFSTRKRRGAAARSLARIICFARDVLDDVAALLADEDLRASSGASLGDVMSSEEPVIRDEFNLVSATVGLSDAERTALLGASAEFSRVILALETLCAALELFGAPEAAMAWLRAKSPEEPFDQRSPLQAMAEDGRLGVEIALLHLRARLRVAPVCGEKSVRLQNSLN